MNALLTANVLFIVKLLFLFAIVIYSIFAMVVVRQVNLMVETLEVGYEGMIKAIAWGHLLFAVGVFVLALIIL